MWDKVQQTVSYIKGKLILLLNMGDFRVRFREFYRGNEGGIYFCHNEIQTFSLYGSGTQRALVLGQSA
jgi:hypothetical protein